MPDAPGLELIAQELNDSHSGAVLETYHDHGQACLIVDPEQVLAVLGWLRSEPRQEYRFLASLHAVDYLPAEPRFGVHYELLNMARVERIRVRAALHDPAAPGRGSSRGKSEAKAEDKEFEAGAEEAAGLPVIDSCTGIFPTAEFQEREAYDFFGIVFRGHPDLRRILMPEEYVGWPLRRDFPIGGEPVIFTHSERETPRWYQ